MGICLLLGVVPRCWAILTAELEEGFYLCLPVGHLAPSHGLFFPPSQGSLSKAPCQGTFSMGKGAAAAVHYTFAFFVCFFSSNLQGQRRPVTPFVLSE